MEDQEEISYYSKEVARGSFWALSGQILFKLVSFFYVILIARAATQEDVGLFYLSFGILSVFAVFSHLGLPASLVRYVPYFEGRNEKGKIRDTVKFSYATLTVIGLFFSCLTWMAADMIGGIYQNPILSDAIKMFSIYLLLNNIFSISIFYLQGRADIKSMQLLQNLQNLFKLVLTMGFFYFFGASVFTIIGAFLVSFLIATIISLPMVLRKVADLPRIGKGLTKKQILGDMVPFGLMLTIVSSFWIIIQASDKILLGYLAEPLQATEFVAVYAIATTAASVLLIFPFSIGSIFLPVLSRLAGKKDIDQMRSVTETAHRWVLFITIPTGIVLIAFSADILGVFFGVTYGTGALAMSVFTAGLLMKSFAVVFSFALAAMRLVKIELEIAFLVAATNIVLNIFLIPPYGMEGAALASFMSLSLMLALLFRYSKKLLGFKVHPSVYKMAVAGVTAFLIVLFLRPAASSLMLVLPQLGDVGLQAYASKVIYLIYLMVLMSISVLLFMLLSLLLKCFWREDVLLMKKAMRRAKIPTFFIDVAERIASYGLAD